MDNSSECPVLMKKRQLNKRARCSNWGPPIYKEMESELTTPKTSIINASEEDFTTMMETTFPQKRKFINNPTAPTVKQIKEDRRVLFSPRGIKYHFKKLTNADIDVLNAQFYEKGDKIMELAKILINPKLSRNENILRAIALHFKEDLGEILYKL